MITVTGATGLLGNTIVRLLLARGTAVRVLTRQGPGAPSLHGLDVECIQGDVTDRAIVQSAVRGASLVIHAAADVRFGRRHRAELWRTNVDATQFVVDACRDHGVRLLHISSVDAFGWGTVDRPADETTPAGDDHGVPYVETKRRAQQIVLAAVDRGLDATIVNPVYLIGPNDWRPSSGQLVLEAIRRLWLPAPRGSNDFADVRDVAAGVLTAAKSGARGTCYILGGVAMSYVELFRRCREAAGVSSDVWSAPVAATTALGLVGDLIGFVTGHEPSLNSGAVDVASLPHHFSDARARRELGYVTRDLDGTVRDTIEWFRQTGMLK